MGQGGGIWNSFSALVVPSFQCDHGQLGDGRRLAAPGGAGGVLSSISLSPNNTTFGLTATGGSGGVGGLGGNGQGGALYNIGNSLEILPATGQSGNSATGGAGGGRRPPGGP